jgi:Domain of unknown function (DUF4375)/HEAT repeats
MSTIILVAVLVTLGIGFAAYWFFPREAADGALGFMDYVRDPTGPERLQAELANRDAAVAKLAKESPETLVAMLKEDANQFGMPARAIEAAGPRIVPALLAAVTDPSFRGGSQKEAFGSRVKEPLSCVLSCLGKFGPAEAVSVVVPLVSDQSNEIRKQVALLLGKVATDEAAEPITQLLQDEDDFVRSNAMMGIRRAIEADKVSEGFRQKVFDALVPLAFRRAISGGGDAPRCLLGLDKQKAIPILTAPDRLRADQENLHEVLRALRESKVRVEEDFLFRILSDLGGTIEYPAEYIYGESLMQLALSTSDRVREVIKMASEHPSQRVRVYAAEAQALASGLDEPLDAVWEKLNTHGWQKLLTPQKYVLAVRMLIDEVKNGGFLQYFVNSSGDYWRDAEAGLDAIGAESDKRIFKEALKLFGSDTPSVDRRARHEQVSAIAENGDRPFEELESEFYKDNADREVLLLHYMLKHVEDFGKNAKQLP